MTTKLIQNVRRKIPTIDRLVRRHRHDIAPLVDLAVEGREQVDRRPRLCRAPDRRPGRRLAPLRVKLDQRRAPRSGRRRLGQLARGRQHQAAKARDVVGEALGGHRKRPGRVRLAQFARQGGEDRLVRQSFAVPLTDRFRGARHDRAQLGVVDAAPEHAENRHEEEHQEIAGTAGRRAAPPPAGAAARCDATGAAGPPVPGQQRSSGHQ